MKYRTLLGLAAGLMLAACVTAEATPPRAADSLPASSAADESDGKGALSRQALPPEALRIERQPCRPGSVRDDGRTDEPQVEVGLARPMEAGHFTEGLSPYSEFSCAPD